MVCFYYQHLFNRYNLEYSWQEELKSNSDELDQNVYWNEASITQPNEIREQKRLILQSSLDRNLYNRSGDDPCTSGVSLCSSDILNNPEEDKNIENNHIDNRPNNTKNYMIKKQTHVWYAAYDCDMKDSAMYTMLDQCENKARPVNKISIKLEDFDVVFANFGQFQSMLYLQRKLWGSWFIKLFLIQKDQLIDIAVRK